jgi:hypothetical protein
VPTLCVGTASRPLCGHPVLVVSCRRGASKTAFPCGAWERGQCAQHIEDGIRRQLGKRLDVLLHLIHCFLLRALRASAVNSARTNSCTAKNADGSAHRGLTMVLLMPCPSRLRGEKVNRLDLLRPSKVMGVPTAMCGSNRTTRRSSVAHDPTTEKLNRLFLGVRQVQP